VAEIHLPDPKVKPHIEAGTRPRMTAAQARATDPALTAWVGASAGTGKTHVLTARVLRLMLTGTKPEHIICLTFTKAAAAEMKNRIFAELGRWALMPDTALKDEISRRTEENPNNDMLARARQLFAEVLDLSPGLQIQTFHSFCQALLGRFPLEAGMAPGFEGVDEADARELMRSAKDEMLASTRKRGSQQLADALSIVARLVTENTFDEVIDSLSFEAPVLLEAEVAYGGPDGLIAAVYRALGLTPGETVQQAEIKATASSAFDETGIRTLGTSLLAGSKSDAERGADITAFVAAPETDRRELWQAYQQVFLTKENTPRKTVATKGVLKTAPDLEGVIGKEQDRLVRIADRVLRLKAADATGALLTLGLAQLSRYRKLKTERGLVDFDDMIERTVSLFSDAGVAPWVLFKLDAAVEHILVDEAQDTNRNQWRVVEALASEFFTGEGAQDAQRTLFAVGDAKQSIFSFQRADPKEFIAARDRVFKNAHAADRLAETVPLTLSFRSGEAVLSLVDAVFNREAQAVVGLSPDGMAVEHDFIRQGQAGLVELWPLEEPRTKETDKTPEWALPLVQESVDDAEERTAWRIARRVEAMISEREMLPSQGRAISAGDILVLVRRRTGFVDHLVRAFKVLGIPVAGRDRMVLTDELAVMDLLVLARFALLPSDDLSLATVLKGPFVGMGDAVLFDLAHARKGTLWQALLRRKQEPKFAKAAGYLSALASSVDLKTPFEFFSHVLTDLEGRRMLVARLGDEIHDPVDELLEEALRFELTASASMLAFVHSVDEGNLQIKRDLEAAGNTVRIMTAHSAKGLQAPIVFLSDLVGLPDVGRDTRIMPLDSPVPGAPPVPVWTSPGKGLEFIDSLKADVKAQQLAEYRRLLYVALTRAEDRLYIAGWRGKDEPSDDCWFKAVENGFARLPATEVPLGAERKGLRFEVAQTAPMPEAVATEQKWEKTPVPLWLFEPMPEEPTPAKPLAPSRTEEEPAVSSPLVRTEANRFARGRLIHAMLEWLPGIAHSARAAAAARYLERHARELAPETRDALWQEVRTLLDDPAFGPIFGPESKAEVPIAGLVLGRAISGQVDRLLVTETEVLVVDYKTNRPPPLDSAGVALVYLRQMGLYARALEGIYPGRTVRAALLWTDAANLMELPKSLMNEALRSGGL